MARRGLPGRNDPGKDRGREEEHDNGVPAQSGGRAHPGGADAAKCPDHGDRLQTGLRISDVLELRTEQLWLSMWVREKKTGKMHRCGLPKDLLAAILAQAGEVWAFPGTKPGTHKTRQAVWKDVKRAAKAFRLPQNIGTHSFRKVYAVRLREKYGSIAKVQRALAHSSLAVTAVYAMADALLSDSQQRRERQRAQRRTVET